MTNLENALYMCPCSMSDALPQDVLPPINIDIMSRLQYFIVENVREARRFLRKCDRSCNIDAITFHELNNHTDLTEVSAWLEPLRNGIPMGMMGDAGCPGVADPGALVAAIAQREGLRVIPLVGPSSILMSLMASGMNGQGFAFNGYLPVKDAERIAKIKMLEQQVRKTGMTQIFIETPYRNSKMLQSLADTLAPDIRICVACGITDPVNENIRTRRAKQWKDTTLPKVPTVFLINS